ncbi:MULTISPECIES: DUF368 domain-containing protein [Salimicrobium]|uniref:DUF368 domain-containing protein n=3 Tax=Salimicrobium TaxID=351195 RepID=K2FJE4_9BACI|nr:MULTISPECIES: DUF368 domain-containing protein [Salimicrobium]AKG05397.1 DUF368 domain-containing protein [Salimicrobium jeotgali]EKE31141.1 hypothetical protein MJ3_09937 [Salimicrobium jeotgali]MBM7697303.1 putative membrane protein [Salimicrobium jeotgali]SDY21980.1 putative membrane protein [Salimicrobium album]SIS84780.1 putative membrane protein [Salimicrobium salexigens]
MWEWKNIYRGLMMGASDVVPGVSGGTIAVVLGIYDRLIEAVNGFFSKEWKRHLKFLLPLGLGIITSILMLANLIEWLFEHYPAQTKFFFLGLIIGVLPFLSHKADVKHKFKTKHYILMLIGVVLVSSLAFFQPEESGAMSNLSSGAYILLFFSGMIASSAMILPGISGSFLLLIIGVYSTVIEGISNFQLDVMAVVGAGIVVGIIVMSKIVKFFLDHYPSGTYGVIIGLVLGSVTVIFPGVPAGAVPVLISILAFLGGLLAAWGLGRVEYK